MLTALLIWPALALIAAMAIRLPWSLLVLLVMAVVAATFTEATTAVPFTVVAGAVGAWLRVTS